MSLFGYQLEQRIKEVEYQLLRCRKEEFQLMKELEQLKKEQKEDIRIGKTLELGRKTSTLVKSAANRHKETVKQQNVLVRGTTKSLDRG